METEQILRTLCAVGAPSGFERPAALAAKELLEPLMDEVRIDRLGNLIGVRRCGKPGAKKLLLDAHLDEVGLVVTGHKDG
ncbi:MAG: M42 family peptidase, partial [Oscillospiraceae bacterium]|nr:M42 family peptidase [Oscillospiraceae bacterium]